MLCKLPDTSDEQFAWYGCYRKCHTDWCYLTSHLTHCGLVMPYGIIYLCVKIGSGNGLLPDGTKPLPDPMLTWSIVQWHSYQSNCTRDTSGIIYYNYLENHLSKIPFKYPMGQWVNVCLEGNNNITEHNFKACAWIQTFWLMNPRGQWVNVCLEGNNNITKHNFKACAWIQTFWLMKWLLCNRIWWLYRSTLVEVI